MDLYLTLMSNSNTDIFVDNKPCQFKNRFINPITIYPDAVVSLAEISYVPLYVMRDSQDLDPGKLRIFDFLFTDDKGKTYGQWHEETIEDSCFSSPKDLVVGLNKAVWRSIKRLRDGKKEIFSWDPIQKRIWAKFEPNFFITILIMGAYLVRLGVEETETKSQALVLGKSKRGLHYKYNGELRTFNSKYRGRYRSVCPQANFFADPPQVPSIDEFIVYSDIVKPHPVAGDDLNSLRFITPNAESDSSVRVVDRFGGFRHYFDVSRTYISELEIQVREKSGELVNFARPVRIVLHFKRRGDATN